MARLLHPITETLDAGQPVNRNHPMNRGRLVWWYAKPLGHPSVSGWGSGRLLDLCKTYHGTNTEMFWDRPLRQGSWGSFSNRGSGVGAGVFTPFAKTSGDFTVAATFALFGTGVAFRRLVDKNYATGFWLGTGGTSNEMGGGIRQTGPFGLFPYTCTLFQSYRLVMVREGTTKRLYLDGTNEQSETVPNTALSSDSLVICNSYNTPTDNQPFPGWIDNVTIYNRAWSAAEAAEDAALERRGYPGVLNRSRSITYTFSMPAGGIVGGVFRSPVIRAAYRGRT